MASWSHERRDGKGADRWGSVRYAVSAVRPNSCKCSGYGDLYGKPRFGRHENRELHHRVSGIDCGGRLTLAEVQSATDFYNEHKELHPTQISPLIAARNQREQNTVAHFAKSASATNEGSVTRVVDYGQEKHGVPPEGEKYSFKMKVRAMSADELAQRCADDPTFKAALDALD